MNDLNKAGDRFIWMECEGEIMRTARNKSWADITFRAPHSRTAWSKRMALPLPP